MEADQGAIQRVRDMKASLTWEQICPHAQSLHNNTGQKRPRVQSERTERYCKRRRATVEEETNIEAVSTNEDEEDPIAYWSQYGQWPQHSTENGGDMQQNILARKRSITSRSRKDSDTDSATASSHIQSQQTFREQKSTEYNRATYRDLLETKNVFMKRSSAGISDSSKKLCRELLLKTQTIPQNTLFDDDVFEKVCELVNGRNEAKVICNITRLIVPSAEILALRDEELLGGLIESVNEGWNNSIPITKTRPQPDYAVGFRRQAFTKDQINRLQPLVGNYDSLSFFMATWYMYFPFLTCEVKCGASALDIADRQNAHSAATAVRAVVELFRAVKREKELHREILAFSISHDDQNVRMHGYYAEIDGAETKYYRHTIRQFSFAELEGREKWTAYNFTKNIYDVWMPDHLERICSAIDQIPTGISFAVSPQSGVTEPTTGLSQDLSGYSIAPSSAGSVSAQVQDDAQSSIPADPVATPSTSVTEKVYKKPRKESSRQGRKERAS